MLLVRLVLLSRMRHHCFLLFKNCSYFILVILYCPIVRGNQALRLSVVLGDVFNMWSFIAFCQVIIFFYRQGILVFHSSQGTKTK